MYLKVNVFDMCVRIYIYTYTRVSWEKVSSIFISIILANSKYFNHYNESNCETKEYHKKKQ